MPSISLAVSGQTSDAYEVGPGARVTASGSGYVEWTSGTLTDVRNGAASWSTWPKGATTGYADTLRRVCIRGVATGALTVTWDEGERDEGPDDAYWQEQVPAWSLDSSGNVQGLVGPDGGVLDLDSINDRTLARTGYEIFPSTAAVVASSSVTGLATATVTIDGEQYLAVTATGVTSGWVELQWHGLGTTFAGDAAIVEYKGDPDVWTTLSVFIGESSAYSVYALVQRAFAAPTDGHPFNHRGTNAFCPTSALWSKNGYSRATNEQIWGAAKLRVNIADGLTGTFYLKSFRVGTHRAYGRLAITIDDGYSSIYRMGLPVLEHYGFRASLGVIPSLIGTATYMTLAQLQDAKARGHEIVAHGPAGGVGDLFTTWATDAEALADVIATREWINGNGLDSPDQRSRKVYIWPQGQYARTAGDPSFVESMRAAGFRVGRTAGAASNTFFLQGRSISANLDGRMMQGVIGHIYAGATNTADDATETTNITTITGRITTLRTDRKDGVLMLHDFARRGAATSGGLYIEMDRLHTICAAIKTGVDAGDLKQVLISELVADE